MAEKGDAKDGDDKENGADEEGEDGEPALKKQKTNAKESNGADPVKKGRGRPKKAAATTTEKKAPSEKKAPAKKREPKPAATADGKPRRSARNAN